MALSSRCTNENQQVSLTTPVDCYLNEVMHNALFCVWMGETVTLHQPPAIPKQGSIGHWVLVTSDR